MKKLTLLILLFAITSYLKAQPGIGCYRVSDGLLYSQKNVFGFYELLGNSYPTSPPACPRVQLGAKTGVTCRFVIAGTPHDEYNYVLYTATGPVQCDLDHYGYAALLVVGILGFWRLRRETCDADSI